MATIESGCPMLCRLSYSVVLVHKSLPVGRESLGLTGLVVLLVCLFCMYVGYKRVFVLGLGATSSDISTVRTYRIIVDPATDPGLSALVPSII